MSLNKIQEELHRYFGRMNQTDHSVQAALTQIKGLNEHFQQNQQKLAADIIKKDNIKNSVNA